MEIFSGGFNIFHGKRKLDTSLALKAIHRQSASSHHDGEGMQEELVNSGLGKCAVISNLRRSNMVRSPF